VTACYSDHNEDIRTKGSCDACGDDQPDLPAVAAAICTECPWDRKSAPGWLGPLSIEEWVTLAHGEQPIACHMTITETDEHDEGDWAHPQMRQCRGAAIYRANVGKMPRRPDIARLPADRERVFVWDEFAEHHRRKP
jgi:hypothetical protein